MLFIDCGNTRLKWYLVGENGRISKGDQLVREMDVSVFSIRLLSLEFEKVLVASVNLSEKLDSLIKVLRFDALKEVRVIDHNDLLGYDFAYKTVENLGIDRCLVIIAARSLSNVGALVIDGGSALTADFVSGDGEHLGGYIFPGCKMLQDSLIEGTSKVFVNDDVVKSLEPGRSTEACVVNAIQVMVVQLLSYLKGKCVDFGIQKIYIAGGDADYIREFIEAEVRVDLVFEGMMILAKELYGELV